MHRKDFNVHHAAGRSHRISDITPESRAPLFHTRQQRTKRLIVKKPAAAAKQGFSVAQRTSTKTVATEVHHASISRLHLQRAAGRKTRRFQHVSAAFFVLMFIVVSLPATFVYAWHSGRLPNQQNAEAYDGPSDSGNAIYSSAGLSDNQQSAAMSPNTTNSVPATDNGAPNRVIISKIGVSSEVKSLVNPSKSKLDFPDTINNIGWYESSAKPGERETILLDAHASGPNENGVLYKADELVKNDTIRVLSSSGDTYDYAVVDSQLYYNKAGDLEGILNSRSSKKQMLALAVNQAVPVASSGDYQPYLVIYAELR